MDFSAIISVAISMMLIMDPFAVLPMFVSMTKGLDKKTISNYSNYAILVAGILLFVFILAGSYMMSLFGITMDGFRIAGGLVLMVMAIQLVFDFNMSGSGSNGGAPWVIIATPLITGPGVITAAILFQEQYGIIFIIVASIVALAITWALLKCADTVMKVAGEKALNIMSRIIGLLLAALSVEYILHGITNWLVNYAPDMLYTILFM